MSKPTSSIELRKSLTRKTRNPAENAKKQTFRELLLYKWSIKPVAGNDSAPSAEFRVFRVRLLLS